MTTLDAQPDSPPHGKPEPTAAAAPVVSPWRLMVRQFRKHRLACWAGIFLLLMYGVVVLCEFLAPYPVNARHSAYIYAPPQRIHLFDQGMPRWPFVRPLIGERDAVTHQKVYREALDRRSPLRFFVRGEPYLFWGLFETDLHLFGVAGGMDEGHTLFLLGTDSLGRDLLSRILYGARVSLTIGLLGVALSFVFGLIVGAVSGYFGGWIDNAIQRFIEILRAFPTLPLWMALSAAVPTTWSPVQVYFAITVVLSLIGWGSLARQVRGKVLSLREEDYVVAAELVGAGRWRLMRKHLLPGMASHIVVRLTLAVPAMILAETALSFLGLGLRPPAVSWGVLLKDAQNVQAVAAYPWLLTPVIFVIVVVLAFNFVGDGLRDAADPFSH